MNKVFAFALTIAMLPPGLSVAQDPFPGFKSNAEIRAEEQAREVPNEVASEDPIAQAEISAAEIVPGQIVELRITILVPTYMPKPPVFPVFDQPNLMISIPEGGTGPVTQRVGGTSWSGVSRRYEIMPLVAGRFEIPEVEIGVTWADPETNAPINSAISLAPQVFLAQIPEGAETLDPFIAAQGLKLTQSFEGDPGNLSPGDSIARTITAEISGTSAILLPALTPTDSLTGLAAYPDSPSVLDRRDRNQITGTRTERTVYLAESGGRGSLPDLELRWYNTNTKQLETTVLEAVLYRVEGPVLARDKDSRNLILSGLAAVVIALLAIIVIIRRSYGPKTPPPPTEASLYRDLMQSVRARDLNRLNSRLDRWAEKSRGPDPRRAPEVQQALVAIGSTAFGQKKINDPSAWSALAKALSNTRRRGTLAPKGGDLPPLNPTRS